MPFYEIIYETGSRSVAEYADDDEAMVAAQAHHERAKAGEPGRGASTARNDLSESDQRIVADYPAERIVKVLKYENHPADAVAVSAEVAQKQLADAIKANTDENGAVDMMAVSQAVRDAASPLVENPAHGESMYKAEEEAELTVE